MVEMLVAVVVLTVGLLGTAVAVDATLLRSAKAKRETQANALTREVLETVRSLPATQLSIRGFEAAVASDVDFDDVDLGRTGWQLRRGRTNYDFLLTITNVDSTLDDTAFGDGNPDDYRKVTVTVTSVRDGKVTTDVAYLATMSRNSGPKVSAVGITPLGAGSVVSGSVNLTATTTSATAVSFSLDGKPIGAGFSSDGKNWSLSGYNTTLACDGPHSIAATGMIDANGTLVPGSPVALALTVENGAPPVPTSFTAAFAGANTVSLNWDASPACDVAKYTVRRDVNCTGVWTVIWTDVKVQYDNIDDQLASPSTTKVCYQVAAIDTGNRLGPWSASMQVSTRNLAPTSPTGLDVRLDPDTRLVTVTWFASTDPDGVINRYTVWRDTQGQADSVVGTKPATGPFRIADSGIGPNPPPPHTYWVQAVDNLGAVSPPVYVLWTGQ
jgi:hypothetical protein